MNALAKHRRITSLARLPCRRIGMGVARRTGAAEPRGRAEEAEDREGGIDHDHASVRGTGCSTVTAEGFIFIGFITPSVARRPAEAPIRPHL
ncbi:hypothetical protein AAFF_G00392990 [Aldrovandia affinis]|uniref:Uncharacterized protein n=1 Tax=Aldrovandia affinis TaxID=143900 RepID=A0AAD7VZ72_9TELE|nr:hypothetical protein AAFF_G00392990 [Aldrovandia affinis]